MGACSLQPGVPAQWLQPPCANGTEHGGKNQCILPLPKKDGPSQSAHGRLRRGALAIALSAAKADATACFTADTGVDSLKNCGTIPAVRFNGSY